MKKGLFLDLDGTLLNNKYEITTRTKKAIDDIKKRGWKVYIATGKGYVVARKFAEQLKLGTPMITSQGQVIIDYPFDVIKLVTQDYGYSKKIFKSKNLKPILKNWTIETLDRFWVKSLEHNETLKLIDNKKKRVEILTPDNEQILIASAIIGLYIDVPKTDDKTIGKLIKKLDKEFPTKDFQYWYTEYDFTTITVKPRITNKWIGVEEVKEREGLDFVVAMGNGWSDKDMLKNSDLGIAMKNSLKSVKEFANRVTEFDNDNEGVAIEIEKILKEDHG